MGCKIIFHACLKAFVPSVQWPYNLSFDFCWSSTHNAFIENFVKRRYALQKLEKPSILSIEEFYLKKNSFQVNIVNYYCLSRDFTQHICSLQFLTQGSLKVLS